MGPGTKQMLQTELAVKKQKSKQKLPSHLVSTLQISNYMISGNPPNGGPRVARGSKFCDPSRLGKL